MLPSVASYTMFLSYNCCRRYRAKQTSRSSDWWRGSRWRIWSDCSRSPSRFICQVPHCTTIYEQEQGWRSLHHSRPTIEQKNRLYTGRWHDWKGWSSVGRYEYFIMSVVRADVDGTTLSQRAMIATRKHRHARRAEVIFFCVCELNASGVRSFSVAS